MSLHSTPVTPSISTVSDPPRGMARWWIYQRERFPLLAHGPLVAAFSFCAVAYSARLRGDLWPDPWSVLVAGFSCLLFFMQLRIADEFKDYDEDCQWRPYRPVPRGLVSRGELGVVFVLAALVQAVLAWCWSPGLLSVLVAAWAYLAAMSCEFGVRRWLVAHPIIYLWSHMLIMPIVDFYAMASDWLPAAGRPPSGLWWFLIASFFNGVVIEIGRKIRSPLQEEPGVNTYTVLWGTTLAPLIWYACVVVTMGCAVAASVKIGALPVVAVLLPAVVLLMLPLVIRFIRHPSTHGGQQFEVLAGLWTLVLYLSLGLTSLWAEVVS